MTEKEFAQNDRKSSLRMTGGVILRMTIKECQDDNKKMSE
jgi:hypothetical protein